MDEQQKEVGTMLPQQETELSQEQEQQTPNCLNRFSVGAFFLGWFMGCMQSRLDCIAGLNPHRQHHYDVCPRFQRKPMGLGKTKR